MWPLFELGGHIEELARGLGVAINNVPDLVIEGMVNWTIPDVPGVDTGGIVGATGESFQHGGVVSETGLAFVHKGETVTPEGDLIGELRAVQRLLRNMPIAMRDAVLVGAR